MQRKKAGLYSTRTRAAVQVYCSKTAMATYTALEAVDLLDASFSSDSDSEIDDDPDFPIPGTESENDDCNTNGKNNMYEKRLLIANHNNR